MTESIGKPRPLGEEAEKPLKTAEMLEKEKEMVNREFSEHFQQFRSSAGEYRYQGSDPDQALSLSGGGIRAGSFAMGLMQALNSERLAQPGHPPELEKMKYLSTVSGGGYSGSAFSWFKRQYGYFPFGDRDSYAGSQQTGPVNDQNLTDKTRSNRTLAFIRQHGNYLTPIGISVQSLLVSALRSFLVSSAAYFLMLVCALTFLLLISGWVSIGQNSLLEEMILIDDAARYSESVMRAGETVQNELHGSGASVSPSVDQDPELRNGEKNLHLLGGLLTIASLGLYLLSSIGHSIFSVFRNHFASAYVYRVTIQKWQSIMAAAAFGGALLYLVPVLAHLMYGTRLDTSDLSFMGSAFVSVASGFLIASRTLKNQADSSHGPGSAGLVGTMVPLVIAGVFILFLLVLGHTVSLAVSGDGAIQNWAYWLVLGSLTFILAILVNINQVSPHKMYRDRLMATFLKDPDEPAQGNVDTRGLAANGFRLHQMAETKRWAPFQLINCNLILNRSDNPKYRGRLGDSFLLSSLYCGSDATGYINTRQFEDGKMTLATACAISGAAVNPNTGGGGRGWMANPMAAFLLTFLGARLGYWCYSPASALDRTRGAFLRPNFVYPGVPSLLGQLHKKGDGRAIEISDGGHFDNTGLYELFRRRVPVIFACDAGSDPDRDFSALGGVISRARVDFGVDVRFRNAEYDLAHLSPGSRASMDEKPDEYSEVLDKKYDLARRGYALAEIRYPATPNSAEFKGLLVYIKSVLTRGLPIDIYSYQSENPAFPYQSIGDQFFDERQLETYRQLGYQVTKSLLKDEKAMAMIRSGTLA